MTLLENSSTKESRVSKVTMIVRQLYKGKQWLIWYSQETGLDKDGNPAQGCGQYLSHGVDRDIVTQEVKNSDGEVTSIKIANEFDIFSEEFFKEKLEEILNTYEIDEKVQLIFNDTGNRSYAGYNLEEFLELDAKELVARGRNGHVNEDISVKFSELTTVQKLGLDKK
jgi:hypothetical protein